MLTHSFDRFFVATKFILSTIQDLKFSTLNFNDKCEYLRKKEKEHDSETEQCIQIL